jgi:mycothiol system anti-sigma-R factor
MSCNEVGTGSNPDSGDPHHGSHSGDHELHRSCRDALERMDEFVDGEIPTAESDEIASHLADCPPCMRMFALEQLLKALVARSCADSAPPQLRARVVANLLSVRIQVRG